MNKQKFLITIISFILATVAFFYGNGTWIQWGWMLWFAVLIVLSYAYSHSLLKTLCFTWLSYAIANIAAIYCLAIHMPTSLRGFYPTTAIAIGSIENGLILAIGVLLSRWAFKRGRFWIALLLLPCYWTSYEYLYATLTTVGNNNSWAFSQAHYLSLMQITSITGIWGVTFLLLFVPNGIALAWQLRAKPRQALTFLLIPLIILLAILIWGHVRITHGERESAQLNVGLIATNETIHDLTTIQPQQIQSVANRYLKKVAQLAKQKPQVILMPERIVSATKQTLPALLKSFANSAKQNQTYLMIGVNLITAQSGLNALYIFSPQGKLLATYYKHHLVAFGPEKNYQAGHQWVTFSLDDKRIGVAICHDMDFQSLGRKYGRLGANILFVPALDFVADAWQHGHNAIIQGIENGYSVVRAAQWGLLTISDQYGQVLAIKSTSMTQTKTLMGKVPYGQGGTFYSYYGDWLAWLTGLVFLIGLLYLLLTRKKD